MFLSKRKSVWYVFYDKPDGKRTCISTKTKIKKEAVKFLAEFGENLKSRIKQKVIPTSLLNFSFEFLKHSETLHTIKTTKAYKVSLKSLVNHFGDQLLTEINTGSLRSYFETRITSPSIYQARKDLICFSAAFNWAISQNYLITNPCSGIKRFKIPEKQPLYYSESEFQILFRNIENEDIRDITLFAVNTGLRQMEIITLTWKQINFKDRSLILDNHTHITKSKKIRSIPLNLNALQILARRDQNKTNDLVFTIDGKTIKQNFLSSIFKKYVIKSGLNQKLNFHSLRHTFASWLIQAGAPIYVVKELLGHSDISTTEIYSHLRTDDLRDSINKIQIN